MCRQRPCSHSESDHLEISPEQAPISPPTHRRPPWPGLCSLRSTCALSRSIEPALHSLISGYPDTHLHGSPLTPSVAHRHASDDPRGASSGLLLRAFTRRHASAQSTRTQHARLLSPSRRTGHGADASTRSALAAYRGPKTGSPATDPGSQRARAKYSQITRNARSRWLGPTQEQHAPPCLTAQSALASCFPARTEQSAF